MFPTTCLHQERGHVTGMGVVTFHAKPSLIRETTFVTPSLKGPVEQKRILVGHKQRQARLMVHHPGVHVGAFCRRDVWLSLIHI